MLRLIASGDPDFGPRLAAFGQRTSTTSSTLRDIEHRVQEVVTAVRAEGDKAIRTLTERFEGRKLEALEIPRAEWQKAADRVAPSVQQAIERAAQRVRAFHERERYASFQMHEDGVRLALRVHPLEKVALYVPGGTARYPSTVIMTAIPAKVAGVKEVIMTTPQPSPETLAAALVAGVDRVFSIGGAQAVAALAYGTETVPRVDKIVGPGNAYVTAAKRLVFGDVGIDALAGPTEVVIAADSTANPRWIAADLLAQAEHDTLAVPILVAVGHDVAQAVGRELERQLAELPRREIAEKSIREQGIAFVVSTVAEAIDVVNAVASEHAELAVEGARAWAEKVNTAGAVFVGHHTPEPVGDYFAGPSHVLPTGGSARFGSPLGVADFLKRTSIIEYAPEALAAQADDIQRLAEVEGLSAHARAVAVRRESV